MIKDWLSRYSIRYPRSLVYMLQASEYNIHDYLSWFQRTKNFLHVENRKTLIKNQKSILLLAIAWVLLVLWLILAVQILLANLQPVNYLVFVLALLLSPYFLAYFIIIPLFFLNIFVQLPIEYFIIHKAKKKLKHHKGLRIAIAGSFGKTTMREILKSVLTEGKIVAAPPQNYNTPLGISTFINTLRGDEEVLIFELGEYYPGDVKKLCALVQPELGIITGINEAHLDKFKTIDKTINTIFELADWLGEKPLYINKESSLGRNSTPVHHIVYSRQGSGRWSVEHAHTSLEGTSFNLISTNRKISVTSKLLGLHQVGPLAAAADIASRLGISDDNIKKGVENTKPFNHRLELKTDIGGITILDDSYNGNPDGVKAVIDFLGSIEGHRRWYITPGLVEMGSQTKEIHKRIGEQLSFAKIENIVLIKNSVTLYIEQGLKGSQYQGDILWFDNALSVFAALPNITLPGDIVLLQNDWPDQYN